MKASELRLGNWYDHHGTPKQVTPSIIEDVWAAQRIWCKPIPLNKEWVLKLGFAIDDDCGWVIEDFEIDLSYRFVNSLPSVNLQYVHQLQNLYHAITGKELTITDKTAE